MVTRAATSVPQVCPRLCTFSHSNSFSNLPPESWWWGLILWLWHPNKDVCFTARQRKCNLHVEKFLIIVLRQFKFCCRLQRGRGPSCRLKQGEMLSTYTLCLGYKCSLETWFFTLWTIRSMTQWHAEPSCSHPTCLCVHTQGERWQRCSQPLQLRLEGINTSSGSKLCTTLTLGPWFRRNHLNHLNFENQ